ncbi:TIGR00270 family protein [Candidatus Woesearchaeota archaeon]|nr:TIGR00270 family protein [Candidatus Woesearchaeota archaeon]
MGSCEICGRNFGNLEKAIVEGVIINVCHDCSKFGKILAIRKPLIEPQRVIPVKTKEINENIINDYAELVKKARERKGLKQEELAKNIAEKESVIHKVETGSMKPSFILAKKLEQYLGVKLIEFQEERKEVNLNLRDNGLTVGDLLKLKNRKV